MHRSRLAAPIALFALILVPQVHAQPDSQSLMREGNSLSRSGLHRAALLRYREATVLGLDSALLAYNLGVTYYELAEYGDAERSFRRAAQDPSLQGLANYNLGLTYRAAGNTSQAAQAFAVVENSATDRTLRRLAVRAAASLSSAEPESSSRARTRAAPATDNAKRGPHFNLSLNAGFGRDDNPNRSPSEPYVDLAQPGQPLVTPEPVAGDSYTPVSIVAEYVIPNEAGDTDFHFRYRLDGEYYGEELAKDESTQRLEIGANHILDQKDNRKRTLRSAFFGTRRYQRNFDPDTGLDRDILGFDVSERFFYGAAGIESVFDHIIGKWQWGMELRVERREHEGAVPLERYDNEQYLVGVSTSYSINPKTTFSFGLHNYQRLFDQRLARNIDGEMLSTNPTLEYAYQGVDIGLKRKITKYVEFDFGYMLLDRTDQFVGYNDYSQDILRLRASVNPHSRFSMSFSAVSRTYDYPNAFAFNVPAAGPKELEDVSGEFYAEFRINRDIMIFGQLATSEVTSTDARAQYSRAQTALGIVWRR
jgi:tetratricopeptide (TPR) repeat protein